MRRACWIVLIAVSVSASGAPAMGKGGSSLRIDAYERVGAVVAATATLDSQNKKQLRRWVSGGPYYAYVSSGWASGRFQVPPLPHSARQMAPIQVGGIEREGEESWSIELRAEFALEGFSPGKYRIDVCSSPCDETIEDLYPDNFRIVANAVEKRLQKRLDDLRGDTAYLSHEVNLMWPRIQGASKGFSRFFSFTRDELSRQSERIDALAADVESAKSTERRASMPLGVTGLMALASALGACAGLFLGVKLRSFRETRGKPPDFT